MGPHIRTRVDGALAASSDGEAGRTTCIARPSRRAEGRWTSTPIRRTAGERATSLQDPVHDNVDNTLNVSCRSRSGRMGEWKLAGPIHRRPGCPPSDGCQIGSWSIQIILCGVSARSQPLSDLLRSNRIRQVGEEFLGKHYPLFSFGGIAVLSAPHHNNFCSVR